MTTFNFNGPTTVGNMAGNDIHNATATLPTAELTSLRGELADLRAELDSRADPALKTALDELEAEAAKDAPQPMVLVDKTSKVAGMIKKVQDVALSSPKVWELLNKMLERLSDVSQLPG